MICLYPEMLRAAAEKEEKAEQAARAQEDRSGPPDPSMICLYPQMLQAAAKEKEKAEQEARAQAQGGGRTS